jgi:tetratricopeptide (TPR) repeat protein
MNKTIKIILLTIVYVCGLKKLLICLFIIAAFSAQVVTAQSDNPALDAEAQKALAETYIPQSNPFAWAIEHWKEKKFFRFTQLEKGETLSIPLAKFYAREPANDAPLKDILEAAQTLKKMGYNAEADKYFEIYLKKNNSDPFDFYQRGENALFAGNYRACMENVKIAFSKDKTDVLHNSYNFLLGICSAELGENKTSQKAFSSLNAHLKNSFYYKLFQDNAFKCTGTADDNYATASFSFTKGNYYPAFRDAFIALKCDPNHLPSLEILQKIAAAADERTDPLSGWANPLKIRVLRVQNKPLPPAFELSEDEKAEFLKFFTNRFQKAFDEKKYDWALTYANEIVLGFPDKPNGYTLRARAVIAQGNFKNLQIAAWLDASKAIEINPKDELAYNVRGIIYSELKKDYAAAIKEYDKGVNLNPNDFRLLLNRGVAHYFLKNYKNAYSDFDRSTTLNPNDFNSFRNKGVAAMELKDYQNAILAFEKAVAMPSATYALKSSMYKSLVTAYDAIGNKVMGDSKHREFLECCLDSAEAKSIENRNPTLVAEWRQTKQLEEQANEKARQAARAAMNKTTTANSSNSSNNAPTVVTAEVKAAYERMHNQVENLLNQANQKVEKFNKNQLIYESLGWRRRMQDEIDLLHIKAADLIRKFMTDYKGKLSQEMIDHLNEDLRKVTWQPGRY